MPTLAGRIVRFILVLHILFAAIIVRADAATGLPKAMEQALEVLRASRSEVTEDRLAEARQKLRAVPRAALDDETWIDLHLLLVEIDRRLSPRARTEKPTQGARFDPLAIPKTLVGNELSDPLAILDLAAALSEIEFDPEAGPPDSGQRLLLATGASRARGLAELAAAIESADPLVGAAAETLSAVAADLAFDLGLLANGQMPEGREGFAWLLTQRHRLTLTPEEALALGRESVSDLLSLLEAEAAELAPGKTWQSLVTVQKEDHPADEEELLAYCRKMTAEAEATVKRACLISIPDFASRPRVVLGTPSFSAPYACYLPNRKPRDGRYGGRVMFTRFAAEVDPVGLEARLRDRSRPWLKVICPHEAIPGHHLQFATASGIKRPCRGYGYSSTYVEGWGLYTEEMMDRAGFYETPAERLAYHRMKLWRAVRVVVDAGLHAGDMRPSEAVRMLTDIVLLERSAAEAEVRRYMTMPTQPLSYLLGYRKIRAIRDAWVVLHGPDSEREFHDRFLAFGPIPLDLAAAVLLGKRSAYDAAH